MLRRLALKVERKNMKKNIVCDCNIIHQDVVSKVMANTPSDEDIMAVADFFKVLGEYTRAKIVFCLLESELCVCDICSLLNMTKSTVSHQLAILKKVNIVKYERRGKEVYYSLDDNHISDIVRETLVHLKHITTGECDENNLA